MESKIAAELAKWKENQGRKPLILRGARQVGKTKALRDFGNKHFKKIAYINLNENEHMRDFLEKELTLEGLITEIQEEVGFKLMPADTLVIFDEIQEAPKALLALKLFYDQGREYFVTASSAVLGKEIYDTDYVNKFIEVKSIYPISFCEFAEIIGNKQLSEFLMGNDLAQITKYKNVYLELMRQYFYVGGMPEAVEVFRKTKNLEEVRRVHNKLLELNENDLLENAPNNLRHKSNRAWASAARQLTKENKKFMYGDIHLEARGKSYEEAVDWIEECGLIHKIYRALDTENSLQLTIKTNSFKAYFLDVGLLGAALKIEANVIKERDKIFEIYERALTEQFVCQELIAWGRTMPFYWIAQRSIGSITFILQENNTTYPIEVQAVENLQAKSLKNFFEKHKKVSAVRTSLSEFRYDKGYINIPLYGIMCIINK